jgi:uncharacterized membrane-anchored protein YhcB (DUF1043 family)
MSVGGDIGKSIFVVFVFGIIGTIIGAIIGFIRERIGKTKL